MACLSAWKQAKVSIAKRQRDYLDGPKQQPKSKRKRGGEEEEEVGRERREEWRRDPPRSSRMSLVSRIYPTETDEWVGKKGSAMTLWIRILPLLAWQ